ncbi:MAG: class I mannose-6-phosphate isomerase [Phycisphaerae bacterium]|nr:class I mannose-6-phosphate isomerase [Phycisphaerae bacterium]
MYPLKFKPIFKERIWGGQKLRDIFGKQLPANTKIGESWELADLPEDKSQITNGSLAGKTIDQAIEQFTAQITGRTDFSKPFPLLIKFLDAENILSVQVHPDKQTCQRMGMGEPKTECWYIISAEPAAVIYKGLKKGVTKHDFAAATEQGNTAELLNRIEVHPGECHFLPAGTPHAIGAGLLIAEIQTPSDTTYRVFDWNRVDDTGKSRQLHIQQALESIRFAADEKKLTVRNSGVLVDSEFFKIKKFNQAKSETIELSDEMKVLIIIKGSGSINDQNSTVTFKAGDTILIPVEFEGVVRSDENTEYLSITL